MTHVTRVTRVTRMTLVTHVTHVTCVPQDVAEGHQPSAGTRNLCMRSVLNFQLNNNQPYQKN